MKNLQKYTNECVAELDAIGIHPGNIISVGINYRATNRWGVCKYRQDGCIIEISHKLIRDEVEDIALKNTLIHELLHTVPGCHGHKGLWKDLAEKVNRYYHYNIQRCTSSEEKGIERPESKYQISCPQCGCVWNYQRLTRAVENPSLFRCGRCKVNLIRIK